MLDASEEKLTRLAQGLAWLDLANAVVVDRHESGWVEACEEGRDETCIGEMGLNGFDAEGGIVGLSERSRNEGERYNECFDHRER